MDLNLEKAGLEGKLDQGWQEKSCEAFDILVNGQGQGKDFLGWLDLPAAYPETEEYGRIKKAAEKIRSDSDVLVVCGIGGSYLGARAVISALQPSFKKTRPEILFSGNMLSGQELYEQLEYLQDKSFSINVISKSGTTTETAIAFRLFKEQLEKQLGKEEARKRIYATTDRERGALKTLADQEGYETFVVPDDVGGRFSVLTPVGLLPIAAAGLDIDALMAGAAEERKVTLLRDFEKNPALAYAAARNYLYQQGKMIEILVSYEPKLSYVQEWWKQLYGESEGKEGKSLFPASVSNTTDLHSLGQWIQQGPGNHFETVITVRHSAQDVTVPADEKNLDQLNYLAGKRLSEINEKAMLGTVQAHLDGQVPNIGLSIERLDEENLGQLLYFFEVAVGVSGYMLGVNPFNQPGVEFYKKNMFHLLNKPGY